MVSQKAPKPGCSSNITTVISVDYKIVFFVFLFSCTTINDEQKKTKYPTVPAHEALSFVTYHKQTTKVKTYKRYFMDIMQYLPDTPR